MDIIKPDTFLAPPEGRTATFPRTAFTVAGATVLALLVIYWPTTYSIYAIWQRSDTFAHGFVVIPIFVWLVWLDRERLRAVPVLPCPPVVAAMGIAGFAWLIARLAAVPTASQFALLFLVQLSLVAILGLSMSRRLAFPLAFLFFAIPFGEFLMPWLMERTADATVVLLKVTGVPVYREGEHLLIPSGSWSVVEACSGLRYLVASLMAGTLFAYLRYRSLNRRLIFVGASIAVPLIANWLRAYGIVMLGHLTNNRLGTNIDHLIYGWLFFGVVMTLLFWIGSRWQEFPSTPPPSPMVDAAPPRVSPAAPAVPMIATALLCVLVSAVWPPLFRHLESVTRSSSPVLHPAGAPMGWDVSANAITSWRPSFANPSAELSQQFTKNGAAVGLYIAYYRNQGEDRRLVSTVNTLVPSSDRAWKMVRRDDELQTMLPEPLPVRSALVAGVGQRVAVRQWFWVDGHYTGSQYAAAALVLAAKLTGRGDDSAAIITYTPVTNEPNAADAILDAFGSEMAPSLSEMLAGARLQR
jgi:exosortase A